MEEEKIVYAPEFTDLQFIKEVSNFPCLYHHMDRDYRNVEKEECWLHIGQSLDCPGNKLIIQSLISKLIVLTYFADIDHLKKKWDVLKKKYIRRRLGVRYKDWPLYESFDEMFEKFIQKKRYYLKLFYFLKDC